MLVPTRTLEPHTDTCSAGNKAVAPLRTARIRPTQAQVLDPPPKSGPGSPRAGGGPVVSPRLGNLSLVTPQELAVKLVDVPVHRPL